MGLGVISISTTAHQHAAGGGDATAIEGASIDGSGNVILGQLEGAAGDPAELTRNAEIPMSNDSIQLVLRTINGFLKTVLKAGTIELTNDATNQPQIKFIPDSGADANTLYLSAAPATFQVLNNVMNPTLTHATDSGDTSVTGSYTSGDNGFQFGNGAWKFGRVVTQAVLPITDMFLEVSVDGVLYKLALCNIIG
jgi:hypothetical protein